MRSICHAVKYVYYLQLFGQGSLISRRVSFSTRPFMIARIYSRLLFAIYIVACVGLGLGSLSFAAPGDEEGESAAAAPPATVEEARARALLLHETLHGALQVMHRDFFRADERDVIPSASLEEVFEVLEDYHGVELRWLGVNARTMDSDHKPRDKFEEQAVQALAAGDSDFDAVEDGRFRFAGAIQLHNECLKCHVPHRTTLEDRMAGLLINIPLKKKP